MNVRHCTNLQTFYDCVTPFLQQREAEHNVMLSLMGDLLRRPPADARAHVMSYVETDAGEVVAVAHFGGSRLVISNPAQGFESAVTLLLNAVASPAIEHIFTPSAFDDSVPDVWFSRTGRHLIAEKHMRVYRLDAVIPPTNVPGNMRWATADDTTGTEWTIHFYIDVFGKDLDPRLVASDMERFTTKGPYRLVFWDVNGQPVSMGGTVGLSPTGMRVGMVYTPVQYRGHGYASALVATLSQSILDSGLQFCTLNTDVNNHTANKIYQIMGYYALVEQTLYDVEPAAEKDES